MKGKINNKTLTDYQAVSIKAQSLTSKNQMLIVNNLGKGILRTALLVILFTLSISTSIAQEGTTLYLPIIFSDGKQLMEYPLLSISNGTDTINLLDPGSGLQLDNPYWQPNIAQLKNNGTRVNPSNADGQALVSAVYDNVFETIPLKITGPNAYKTVENLRRLFQMSVGAQNYYTTSFEQDQVYFAVKPKGNNFLTGYAAISTMSITNISNPYGAPFVNDIDVSQFDTVNLIIEREPFFSPLVPGEIIGPLYNLIKNPDFELWNFGIVDSQPDSWTDLEDGITGTNNRYDNAKWGEHALDVSVTESVAAGEFKGVTQIIEDTKDETEYTIITWVKNDGITKGIGRILVNYSDQLVLYSSATQHDWTLYTGKITTGIGDTVSINCEILSTDTHTIGNVYFDGLMFIEGDYEQYAKDNLLMYISASHIVNNWSKTEGGVVTAGYINWVDGWNIPGDISTPIHLEFLNNEDDPITKYGTVRIGLRRTANVFYFDNFNNFPGIYGTNVTNEDYVVIPNPLTFWTDIGNKIITDVDNTKNNIGRYKLIIRIYDPQIDGNIINFRGRYFLGTAAINNLILPVNQPNIKNNWTIVELTENDSMNLESKNQYPPQMGYFISAQRDNDTEGIYLDYAMLIPTDGGYINASLNPALYSNLALLISNINQNLNASLYQPFSFIWKPIYTDTNNLSGGGRTYNGYFYIQRLIGGTPFISRTNLITTEDFDLSAIGSANFVVDLIEYNNLLYYIIDGYLYETDGETFPGTQITDVTGGDVFTPFRMKTFNGKLYWSGNRFSFPGPVLTSEIYSYDGTAVQLEHTMNGVLTPIMEIYNNRLYVIASNAGTVYLDNYNPITDSWTSELQGSLTSSGVIKSYKGKLYGTVTGTEGAGIYYYAGGTWTFVNDNSSNKFQIYNNTLFATDSSDYTMLYTNDGSTWIKGPTGASLMNDTYNNMLMGYKNNVLYSLVSLGSDTPIQDFEGVGFYAPNRKLSKDSRHRYFFSYDRDTYVNDINDKALIGIGYRPQYFSLINRDDF